MVDISFRNNAVRMRVNEFSGAHGEERIGGVGQLVTVVVADVHRPHHERIQPYLARLVDQRRTGRLGQRRLQLDVTVAEATPAPASVPQEGDQRRRVQQTQQAGADADGHVVGAPQTTGAVVRRAVQHQRRLAAAAAAAAAADAAEAADATGRRARSEARHWFVDSYGKRSGE